MDRAELPAGFTTYFDASVRMALPVPAAGMADLHRECV
jgi:hypothetical protein